MPTTCQTTKARLMWLGEFAASFEAKRFEFSGMRGVAQVKPGLFTLPWTDLSQIARKFLAYSEDRAPVRGVRANATASRSPAAPAGFIR